MTARRRLVVSWGLLGLVVAVALVAGSVGQPPPTPAERARALSAQFACPRCDGQSVLNSDVAISVQIRAEIAQRVESGQTDDQVLSFLTQAYGREYLLTPSASGAASLVWALPVFLAVCALAGLVVAFRRWRPTPIEVTDDERLLVGRARQREDRE